MIKKNINGVILAGGAGKRFNGLIKSKILINGKPIILRIIEAVSEVFDEIIIVTNTPDEFKEYSNNKIVEDKFHNKGPLCGIHSALTESGYDASFVIAGDMPFPDKELILNQIEYFNKSKCEILVPDIGGYTEPLHAIYSRSVAGVLEEYLKDENDYSIRGFYRKCKVLYFPLVPDDQNRKAFININSQSDVESVKRLFFSNEEMNR